MTKGNKKATGRKKDKHLTESLFNFILTQNTPLSCCEIQKRYNKVFALDHHYLTIRAHLRELTKQKRLKEIKFGRYSLFDKK